MLARRFLKDSKYLVAESEHGQEAMATLNNRLFDLFYEYTDSGYRWLYEIRFIPQWEKDKERGCPNFGDYLLRDKRCLT